MKKSSWIILLISSLLLSCTKHEENFSFNQNKWKKIKQDLGFQKEGSSLYLKHCKLCHGEYLQGGIGPNLSHFLTTKPDQSLYDKINIGVINKGMPAWQGRISDDDILKIMAYLKSVK